MSQYLNVGFIASLLVIILKNQFLLEKDTDTIWIAMDTHTSQEVVVCCFLEQPLKSGRSSGVNALLLILLMTWWLDFAFTMEVFLLSIWTISIKRGPMITGCFWIIFNLKYFLFSEGYLDNNTPVSFHKHWNCDPLQIYANWFGIDDMKWWATRAHDFNDQEFKHEEL